MLIAVSFKCHGWNTDSGRSGCQMPITVSSAYQPCFPLVASYDTPGQWLMYSCVPSTWIIIIIVIIVVVIIIIIIINYYYYYYYCTLFILGKCKYKMKQIEVQEVQVQEKIK